MLQISFIILFRISPKIPCYYSFYAANCHHYSAVTIHWTGLLDWNTGLDYWTKVFSFFGQNYVVFQIFDTWRPQLETIEFL